MSREVSETLLCEPARHLLVEVVVDIEMIMKVVVIVVVVNNINL